MCMCVNVCLCMCVCRAVGQLAKAEGRGVWGDGKGPPSDGSDFFAMRCTISTIYFMMQDQLGR